MALAMAFQQHVLPALGGERSTALAAADGGNQIQETGGKPTGGYFQIN